MGNKKFYTNEKIDSIYVSLLEGNTYAYLGNIEGKTGASVKSIAYAIDIEKGFPNGITCGTDRLICGNNRGVGYRREKVEGTSIKHLIDPIVISAYRKKLEDPCYSPVRAANRERGKKHSLVTDKTIQRLEDAKINKPTNNNHVKWNKQVKLLTDLHNKGSYSLNPIQVGKVLKRIMDGKLWEGTYKSYGDFIAAVSISRSGSYMYTRLASQYSTKLLNEYPTLQIAKINGFSSLLGTWKTSKMFTKTDIDSFKNEALRLSSDRAYSFSDVKRYVTALKIDGTFLPYSAYYAPKGDKSFVDTYPKRTPISEKSTPMIWWPVEGEGTTEDSMPIEESITETPVDKGGFGEYIHSPSEEYSGVPIPKKTMNDLLRLLMDNDYFITSSVTDKVTGEYMMRILDCQ